MNAPTRTDGSVRVATDAGGVPVVTAGDRAGAAYGLGWATARDRLFQLMLYRRRALGRLAEVFGPTAVPHDTAQRVLGVHLAAERMVTELPLEQRDLLESYAAGVNAYLAAGEPLPLEFSLTGTEPAPWRPADSAAVALLLAQMLGSDGSVIRTRSVMAAALPTEAVRFLLPGTGPYGIDVDGSVDPSPPPPPPDDLVAALVDLAATADPDAGGPVVGADEAPFGSNAWAVSGRRTTDGRAIVANDMHLPLTAPCIFYRAALRYAGHRIDGVVVPGVPLILAGCSDRIAWGVTRLVADNVELVALDVPADAPDRYRTGTGTEEFDQRIEKIEVRGGEQVSVTVRRTRWGPVYGRPLDGAPMVLRWRPLEPGGLDLGLVALPECGDVEAACDVANASAAAPLNVVLADADGRVAWTVTGSFPARQEFSRVVRPHLGERPWQRVRAAGELPRVVDPPSGFVVVANNLTPSHASVGYNGFSARRAYRVAEVLAESAPATERGMLRLQFDDDARFYDFYRELLRQAVAGRVDQLPVVQREAFDAVESWDGRAGVDSVGFALLMLLRENLRETLFTAVFAGCRRYDSAFRYAWHDHEQALRTLLTVEPAVLPRRYPDRAALVLSHLELSAVMLRATVGKRKLTEVTWGELNRTSARHPLSAIFPDLADILDLPDAPMPGCAESVHLAHPGFGPAVRFTASPAHPQDALLHLAGGQSGDPRRPGYADQFRTWSTGEPTPMLAGPPVAEVVLTFPPRAAGEEA